MYAVRIVLLMSAAIAAPEIASANAPSANARPSARCMLIGSLLSRLAALEVDVVVLPGMPVEHGVLVSEHPGLHEDILVAVRVQDPGGIGVDDLRHLPEQRGPLWTVGELLRLLVE